MILIGVIIVFVIVCYFAYSYAFGRSSSREAGEMEFPDTDFRSRAVANAKALLSEPFREVTLTSFDGTRLYGRYYNFRPGGPVALMFHGYRSNYCRDGNGGFALLKELGYNILLPDQRGHGKSGGRSITFGVKESRDCAVWVEYIKESRGEDTEVVLMGVSMGAATVTMASDMDFGGNVKAIVADCGYTSPREIIKQVARGMHLPAVSYHVTRLGARLFGGFDPEEKSSVRALATSRVPVLFIHGDKDNYVPCSMSEECFRVCASPKEILIVPGASHGTSYYVDTCAYRGAVREFLQKYVKN